MKNSNGISKTRNAARYHEKHPNARYYTPRTMEKCKRYAEWGACFNCPYKDCVLVENATVIKGLYPDGFNPHTEDLCTEASRKVAKAKRCRPRSASYYAKRANAISPAPTLADLNFVAGIFGIGG